jgi:DNA-binding PadR family transcriptional regulator
MRGATYRHGELRLELLSLFAERPRHGYEIMQLLRTPHGGQYSPSAGAIYPRIQKLKSEGLIEEIESGRRRVFAITQDGRDQLASKGLSVKKQQEAAPGAEALLRRTVVDAIADLEKIQMRVRRMVLLGCVPVHIARNSLRRFNTSVEQMARSLQEILSDTSRHVEARVDTPDIDACPVAAAAAKRVDDNRGSK